jgi:hypothetical protein
MFSNSSCGRFENSIVFTIPTDATMQVSIEPTQDFEIDKLQSRNEDPLWATDLLSDVFSDPVLEGYIHIIVQVLPPRESSNHFKLSVLLMFCIYNLHFHSCTLAFRRSHFVITTFFSTLNSG